MLAARAGGTAGPAATGPGGAGGGGGGTWAGGRNPPTRRETSTAAGGATGRAAASPECAGRTRTETTSGRLVRKAWISAEVRDVARRIERVPENSPTCTWSREGTDRTSSP